MLLITGNPMSFVAVIGLIAFLQAYVFTGGIPIAPGK